SHSMGRKGIHRRAGRGLCAHTTPAPLAGRPRIVVLRRQDSLAIEPDVFVPALEDRSRRVAPIPLPAGNRGAGGRSRSAGPEKAGPAARLSDFRRHVFPLARFLEFLSLRYSYVADHFQY